MIRGLYYQMLFMVKRMGKRRRGSPLVEESILLGISLFAFMILASIVFDLVEFARGIFDEVTKGLDRFPS